jgi:hypothetical protein
MFPTGPGGVKALGHRTYVGGLWDEIGKLQFDFLVAQGLQPHHYLLDIACGSLRAGVHFIPYLEPGHYLGIEKEKALVQEGVRKELRREVRVRQRPVFVISKSFEFHKFKLRPHYALAQSLFTHLPDRLIADCFGKLRRFIRDEGVFYATFNEVAAEVKNPDQPHDHEIFHYTIRQMAQFGADHGWHAEYIGDWKHPRQQKMMRYLPI